MKHLNAILLAIIVIANLSSCTEQKTKVSQWRGTERNGIYNETGLLKSWPETGPELLWSFEGLGNGYGSPVVSNGKVFVNGEIDSTAYLFCFDLKGNILWKSPYGKEYTGSGFSAGFPGGRSTPTIVENLAYVSSGTGKIACFETEKGVEKWSIDMVTDLKGLSNEFGYSESLIVEGDRVYCFPGGPESNVVALNRLTGEIVWTSKALADTVSFCSPTIIASKERKVLVTFSVSYIFGLDVSTGELLWSQKQDSIKYGVQGNTPIYENGFLYYIGDGNGLVKLAVAEDGKSVSEVWRNPGMQNGTGGFVIVDNTIYATSSNQKLLGIDKNTGVLSDSLRIGRACTIYADGHLYCYSDKTEMNLISLENGKIEKISSFKTKPGTKEALAHPAISDGILFVRHGNILLAYNIKG